MNPVSLLYPPATLFGFLLSLNRLNIPGPLGGAEAGMYVVVPRERRVKKGILLGEL